MKGSQGTSLLLVLAVACAGSLLSCAEGVVTEDPSAALVSSCLELKAALADSQRTRVLLTTDIQLTDGCWPAKDVVRIERRAVNVSSADSKSSSHGDWAFLDLNFVTRRVSLLRSNLTFTSLFVFRFRNQAPAQLVYPGLDFIAGPPPNSSRTQPSSLVRAIDAIAVHTVAFGYQYYSQAATDRNFQAARPAGFPGVQAVAAFDTPICRRASARYPSHCWRNQDNDSSFHVISVVQRGVYMDEEGSGLPVLADYYVVVQNVTTLLNHPVSLDCIRTRGAETCLHLLEERYLYTEAIPTEPSTGKSGPQPRLAIILPCVLGGTALLLLCALAVRHYFSRRTGRQGAGAGPPSSTGSGEAAAKQCVVILHTDPAQPSSAGAAASAGYAVTGPSTAATATCNEGVREAGRAYSLDGTHVVQVTCESSNGPNSYHAQSLVAMPDQRVRQQSGSPSPSISSRQTSTAPSASAGIRLDLQLGKEVRLLGQQPPAAPQPAAAMHENSWSEEGAADYQQEQQASNSNDGSDADSWALGVGLLGEVQAGDYEGRAVAVKLLHPSVVLGPVLTEYSRAALVCELEALARCEHRNIVRLLGAGLSPPRPFLCLERMPCSLHDIIYDMDKPLPLHQVLHIASDVACGLAYLHPTIVHRDLKPHNVLLDGPAAGCAKLCDFGLARIADIAATGTLKTENPEVGTAAYMAPECFQQSGKLTPAMDIFSLGVIMVEMINRIHPWPNTSPLQIAVAVSMGKRVQVWMKDDPTLCPQPLHKLIQDCMAHDPKRRPSAAEVVKRLAILSRQIGGDQISQRQHSADLTMPPHSS